jgi:uncharacterized protein (TIGR02118 family)
VIKISVFYPTQDGGRFDMDYYLRVHIPMVREKLGAACKSVAVEQGLSGMAPGTPPTYCVSAHMVFESVEKFQSAFAPHANAIMADIPNYTSLQPVIQIGEVKL